MSIIVLSAGCAKRQSVSPRAQFPRWNSLHTYAQNNTRCRGTARRNLKGQGVSHASKRQTCPLPLLVRVLQQLQFKKPFIFSWMRGVHLFYTYVLGSSGSSLVLWLNELKMQHKHSQIPFLFSVQKATAKDTHSCHCSCKTSWESQSILSLSDYTLYSCRLTGREGVPLAETQGKYTSDALYFLWGLQTKLRAYLK